MADIFHEPPPAASTVALWFHYRRLVSMWFLSFLLNQDSLTEDDALLGLDSGPKMRPLPETVPKGVSGELYRKFRLYVVVDGGCAPLPVVDEEGNTGDKEGQVYVHSGWHRHQFAIMYAWYFHSISHCHEGQAAVVWLRGPNHDCPTVRGVALTKSGEWIKTKTAHLDGTHVPVEHCNDPLLDLDGDRFLEYQVNPLLGHGLATTAVRGKYQPTAAW
ncbi:uncharacterized protein IWZ02DRAFT_489620 [Phyllosticta citriasiana]|uniref:Uncharacterized protein n=1 Tax=Phyllosticta citriasiana TaxID=595635 RepID=A0ABR1KPF0_9PEZI